MLSNIDNVLTSHGFSGLQNVIGSGQYGKVYKVERTLPSSHQYGQIPMLGQWYRQVCLHSGQQFAAKILPKSDAMPELRALSVLRHPNIVELLSYLESEVADHSILIMELCAGSLQNFLQREGVLGVPAGVNIIESVFIGLAYIHACCIVHCDISMANILMSQEGEVRIADFGLMRCAFPHSTGEWLCRRHMTEELVTLWYRCPELILGCTTFSGKVDVFSAGAIFVQLITGQVAFPGDSEIGTLFKIYQACGSPAANCSLCELPYFSSSHPRWPRPLQCMNIPGMNAMLGDHISQALQSVLAVAPESRATAQEILVQFWSTRAWNYNQVNDNIVAAGGTHSE